jgi:hypothetical protein
MFTFRHETFRKHIAPIMYDSIVILYDKIKINKDYTSFKALQTLIIDLIIGELSSQKIFCNFESAIILSSYREEYILEIKNMYSCLSQ